MGFGSHPHQNMETITYVLEGTLAHKNGTGHQENINARDIQKMSAGTGVMRSEFNTDIKKAVHIFQIWILPNKRGVPPEYQQTTIQKFLKDGLLLIASSQKGADTIFLQQDAQVFIGCFKTAAKYSYNIKPKRGLWLQMTAGHTVVNEQELNASDAAAVENEPALTIKTLKDSKFLLFDLA